MKRCFEVCCVALVLAACGEDSTEVAGAAGSEPTAAAGAGGTGSTEPACVENPVTHLDIINACDSYARVRKTPELTLLQADGSLPPP